MSSASSGTDGDGASEPEAQAAPHESAGDTQNESGGEAVATAGPTFRQILRDTYLSFDRRTLGFARILYGFLLVTDLFRRTWTWEDMYSNVGVLPNHVILARPQAWGSFSLLNAFSSPAEMWVLWGVVLATFLCMLVGYKTRIAQILTVIFVTSMDGRVLLIENGGYTVYNLLALWTCFLPLGDRFSVDALLASMKARRESSAEDLNQRSGLIDEKKLSPHVTLLGFVLLVQISSIYFFNVLHKSGMLWKNGTAVHYVLHVDRMVTPAVAAIRDYIPTWMIIALTRFTLGAEAGIPVCLLSPLGRTWARRLAIVLINALHIGFGTVFVLGPFSWACCVFSTFLFSTDDWEIAIRTMRRTHRARVVVYDPRSGFAFWLCRLLVRLDRFELLTFRSEEGSPLSVEDPATGRRFYRSQAIADILAALPLGPVVAWMFRLPGIRHAIGALLQALQNRSLSRAFGLPAPGAHGGAFVNAPPSPARRGAARVARVFRELAILVMFAAAANEALIELWVFTRRFKIPQPELLSMLVNKLRFRQGWFMFSPEPPLADGNLVVEAVTVDGRKVDPFTGREPNFELLTVRSFGYNQIWSDYLDRVRGPANSGYRDAMREYMYRLPERTGRPEDAIVSGDVYWVSDVIPRFGQHESSKYQREKVFSFVNPKAQPRAATPSALDRP